MKLDIFDESLHVESSSHFSNYNFCHFHLVYNSDELKNIIINHKAIQLRKSSYIYIKAISKIRTIRSQAPIASLSLSKRFQSSP